MRELTNEIEWLETLQGLVVSYEEIAAHRMQKIRERVLTNRDFLSQINEMFVQVKSSYRREAGKQNRLDLLQKRNKKALVFLSANTGLYGDLVLRIFELLKADLKIGPAEVVIIGSLGRTIFEQNCPGKSFTYFDLPDAVIEFSVVKPIVDRLTVFEEVVVYHGLFKNLVSQNVVARNITGGEEPVLPKLKPIKTIFEPTIGQVLSFFETEIFSSLFLHALYEGQLAKFSARIELLNEAEDNLRKAQKIAFLEKDKARHREENAKQQEMITWWSASLLGG